MRKELASVCTIVLALGAGPGLSIAETRTLSGGSSFTKSETVKAPADEHSVYYRLKVNLSYKGELLDFDIVVGCRVSITTYKDNDRTVEVAIAPMLYGLKMKDGHGVVVKPPEACDGATTDNGKVPASLLPLVVTYEKADQPWFGLAYASADAYASPISELKFFGATISLATRDEWQDWRRREAPKNFISYELLGINAGNIWNKPRWRPGYRAMPSSCVGFSWVELPEPVRDAVRAYWPSSKPRYWYPNLAAEGAFRAAGDFDGSQKKLGRVLFDGKPLNSYFYLPTNQPNVRFLSKDSAVGSLYPAMSDISFNRLDDGGEPTAEIKAESIKSYAQVKVDPQLKGFAYCDLVHNIDAVPPVASVLQPLANRINGEKISEDALTWHQDSFSYAFERDEYVIFYRVFPIVSIFGGL